MIKNLSNKEKKIKKIIFLIKDFYTVGGAENVLKEILKILSKQKNLQIFVITLGKGEAYFFDKNRKIKIFEIPFSTNKFLKLFKKGEVFLYIFQIIKIVNQLKPDVVFGWMSSSYIFFSFIAIFKKFKFIASEHTTYRRYRFRFIENILFLISALIIKKYTVCTASAKKTYPSYISSKMNVVRNPKLKLQNLRYKKDIIPEKIVKVISVGRLVKSKDHLTSIKAFSLISNKFPEINFEIWGSGTEKDNLEKVINKLGLKNRIFLKGVCSDHSILYPLGSIMINSTRYESDAISVKECVGYGIPVICFDDVPALKVQVQHLYNGIILSSYNRVQNLAKALENVLENPELFKSIYNKTLLDQSSNESVSWEDFVNSI